jgi:ribonuclease-3
MQDARVRRSEPKPEVEETPPSTEGGLGGETTPSRGGGQAGRRLPHRVEGGTGGRLPRPTGSDNAARLARALQFRFRDLGLLRTALTHRSILHEVATAGITGSTAGLTNERLEFLGDAVLGAVAAEYLYNLDPNADEGELTRRRVALVRAETLVRWARDIDLGSYLYLGLGERPGEGSRDRMLAGAFEALIGAIALDRGFGAARRFLLRLLERDAPEILARAETMANPKGRLQELLQERYRRAPNYHTVATEGPDHARIFVVDVSFGDLVLGRGTGSSKREAEQAAAAAALAALAGDPEGFLEPLSGTAE